MYIFYGNAAKLYTYMFFDSFKSTKCVLSNKMFSTFQLCIIYFELYPKFFNGAWNEIFGI